MVCSYENNYKAKCASCTHMKPLQTSWDWYQCGLVQGFAESLQHDSSNQSEIVMIKLYCCGPGYCSIYPLLYYFFQIRNGLGSSVFKLCCKDSAKPCIYRLTSEEVRHASRNADSVCPFLPSRQYKKGHASHACRTSSGLTFQ